MQFDLESGEILLIDKPIDWTSFDVVNHLRVLARRQLGIQKLKAGHAGTLDPLASGLLIVCTGKLTKKIQQFQDLDKTYQGRLQLGMTTPSYDLETEADAFFDTGHLTTEMLVAATKSFTGKIEQLPPLYSAIKIDGKRAFHYARKQKEVELKARLVNIHRFEITKTALPFADFEVDCSKGTYIRSLVHDFGKLLENGACLTALRRTRIGQFTVENALTIEQLREHFAYAAEQGDTQQK
ncbi:tRNA pseudouridine(55) synthase TruB [Bacteroidales bacterium]